MLLICFLVLGVIFMFMPKQAEAADKWFDSNGVTGGGGDPCNANVSGGNFWSSSDAGTDPALWVTGDTCVFSAGSPANTTATCNSSITAAGIKVEDGRVVIGGTAAIIIGAGSVTVNSGTTLSTNSSTRISASAGSVFYVNGGTLECTNPGLAGSFIDVDSTIALSGGGTFTYTVAGQLNIIQGTTIVSGSGPLTKNGAGILAIASPCTYSGATIINDGTLRIRTNANRLPIGTDMTVNSPGVFDPAVGQQLNSINGNGAITYSSSGTMTIAGSGASSLSGIISDGSAFGKLTKSGSGSLTLSGANTYDGTFTLSAGTTTVTSTGKLIGAAGDVVVNGGTLNLNNAAQTIENLSGTGGTINLALGHTLTTAAVANTVYSGSIDGQGALTIANAFTLALNGVNSYSGGTNVNAGTLEVGGSIKGNVTVAGSAFLKLNNSSALDSGATVNLAASPAAGTVKLDFSGTQTIKSLNFGAADKAQGTWGAIGSGADHENAAFTGTGKLLVTFGPPLVTDEGKWKSSLTTLSATWTAASDVTGSGTASYEYAIGTTPDIQDTKGWTNVGNVLSMTDSSLSLTNGQTYYIQVRAIPNVGPNGTPSAADGITIVSSVDVIGNLWPLSDGGDKLLLKDKIVTAVAPGAFWIEETDQSAAVKVVSTETVARGDKVSVAGVLGQSGTQRAFLEDGLEIAPGGPFTVPGSLGMKQSVLGGQDVNVSTKGVTNSVSLYSIGLLARVWGNVTHIDTSDPNNKFFYMDDGCNLSDGGSYLGVRVLCGGFDPPTGHAVVTGIISNEQAGLNVVPTIIVTRSEDMSSN